MFSDNLTYVALAIAAILLLDHFLMDGALLYFLFNTIIGWSAGAANWLVSKFG